MNHVGVIGGGAWGTALAASAARAGRSVLLWAREAETAAAINEAHENRRFLPGIPLDPSIRATGDLSEAARADLLLLVCPAQHMAEVAGRLAGLMAGVDGPPPAVICAKGLERETGALMTEAVGRAAPDMPLAVLSGPTFAVELARGQPAAASLACTDGALGAEIGRALRSPSLRPYLSDDPVGVQIGGAVKNVIAIAAGIAVGRGLGENARAAIIARGFAEIARLAVAKGARPETPAGLSGLGDLALTCTGERSRNYSLGRLLGKGSSLEAALGGRDAVTEGVASAPAVLRLAARLGVEMPIAKAVDAVLHRGAAIDETVEALLARPLTTE